MLQGLRNRLLVTPICGRLLPAINTYRGLIPEVLIGQAGD
jgi:hypothetical protein